MNVFILAGCRTPILLSFAICVFKSLRVGFPTANVKVLINPPIGDNEAVVIANAATAAGCKVQYLDAELLHHEFVEQLIITETEPFYLCDTDVIFYSNVEGWKNEGYLVGALIPEFQDEFTKAVTRSRLHTSLLYVSPEQVREIINDYTKRHPATIYNPPANLFYPLYLPLRGRTVFYDTASMLYHAIGGTPFSDAQLDAYFHFHFGTCSDVVIPYLKEGQSMEALRGSVLAWPETGRGMWRVQKEYFEERKPVWDGKDVIAKINDENAKSAVEWCTALCCGNRDAMTFCDIWYRYAHSIDDLVDTLEDGRPTMSKEQMISIFFTAALLYNCDFYIANRQLLGPIVLQVTNTYQDSVAWERSSKKHLRQMADIFRTCGNEMYVMVALLCGGEQHMRKMSMAIKERDWLGQHDEAGRPM